MSIFKTNKFFRVIKHFILCLPLMFVLGTSIYAIVNPNAKDSYSDNATFEVEYRFKSNEINTIDDFISGNLYAVNNTLPKTPGTLCKATYVQGTRGTDLFTLQFEKNNYLLINISTYWQVAVYDNNELLVSYQLTTIKYIQYLSDINSSYLSYFSYTDYNEILGFNVGSLGYLDNAFQYGLQKFNDIGFGKVDFITLFNNIFTTSVDNVYLHFINDYLNYYLMVECIYFIPWVLHTFIHFAYDLGEYFTDSFKRKKGEDD